MLRSYPSGRLLFGPAFLRFLTSDPGNLDANVVLQLLLQFGSVAYFEQEFEVDEEGRKNKCAEDVIK